MKSAIAATASWTIGSNSFCAGCTISDLETKTEQAIDTSDENISILLDSSEYEDMSIEEMKVIFKADDLDDGKYHWELSPLGKQYTSVARNISPELRGPVLFVYDIIGSSNEWFFNMIGAESEYA